MKRFSGGFNANLNEAESTAASCLKKDDRRDADSAYKKLKSVCDELLTKHTKNTIPPF